MTPDDEHSDAFGRPRASSPNDMSLNDSVIGDHSVSDTVITEVVVEADQGPTEERSNGLRSLVEWVAVIVTALVAALVIKAFVFQAFEIPTGSMETTVNIGDRILVNKLSYRFGDVERGDLVVFHRLEGTPGTTDELIKRAIGLPGETVEVRDDGRIWIWGPGESADEALRLDEPYLDAQNAILQSPRSSDSINSDIWHEGCVNQPREPGRCTLDSTSYFMMGDNRFGSSTLASSVQSPRRILSGAHLRGSGR